MADPIDELLKQLDQGNPGRSSHSPNAQSANTPEAELRSIEAPAAKSIEKSIDQLLAEIEDKPVMMKSRAAPPDLPIRSEVELRHVDPIENQPRPLKSENHQRTQQQEAIVRRAQAWLNALDPQDGNALFFERFAEKYPSRLEAAIDFLGLGQE